MLKSLKKMPQKSDRNQNRKKSEMKKELEIMENPFRNEDGMRSIPQTNKERTEPGEDRRGRRLEAEPETLPEKVTKPRHVGDASGKDDGKEAKAREGVETRCLWKSSLKLQKRTCSCVFSYLADPERHPTTTQ